MCFRFSFENIGRVPFWEYEVAVVRESKEGCTATVFGDVVSGVVAMKGFIAVRERALRLPGVRWKELLRVTDMAFGPF
jgi:hypothetical protein